MAEENNQNKHIDGQKGQKSVKRLKAAGVASAYQKEWFLGLKDRVGKGEPFAFLNADVPLELFEAMEIPFVVNQWWAAICSAKQMSRYFFDLLKERNYRSDLCTYCATSLASAFDPEPEKGPWGGLPKPTLAVSRLTCDSMGKIFDLFAKQHGIPFYPMENTISCKVPDNWWDKAWYEWEDMYDKHRLDVAVEELKALIRFLEMTTGKMFYESKLEKVMDLVNQQEEYYTKTRDLIAKTYPAPVGITDTLGAVMIPQWHRGTQWAVDSAKMFYDEIKEMAERGDAACKNEKIRLMWVGRGLWFNLGFYQHFEEKYGAVFEWSMYLSMGADAYRRYGNDALRMLAARYIGMEDFLHMPPWNCDWFVSQAKKNGIQGVVYLVPENCMQAVEGSYFITKALEDSGIPVLQLRADPVDARKWNQDSMTTVMEDFIENRIGGGK